MGKADSGLRKHTATDATCTFFMGISGLKKNCSPVTGFKYNNK